MEVPAALAFAICCALRPRTVQASRNGDGLLLPRVIDTQHHRHDHIPELTVVGQANLAHHADLDPAVGDIGTDIAVVGMRVDQRTLSSENLRDFCEGLGLPVLGYLRDTQNYIRLAMRGLTLFDVPPGQVAKDLEQWQLICDWLEA